MTPMHAIKRWYSIAEYAVFFIVLGVLFAAVIPIFIRIWAYNRNWQRITDITKISQQIKSYHTKNWEYPSSLRELEKDIWWPLPKDPSNKVYCTNVKWYQTWDYQYYTCENCEAVGPFKTYSMKNIAQVWAIMEWENKRWERNSWNRWAKYQVWEDSDCAANAVRWAWTLIEWIKWNWVWGTWSNIVNIPTFISQPDYDPRYNVIISMERN